MYWLAPCLSVAALCSLGHNDLYIVGQLAKHLKQLVEMYYLVGNRRLSLGSHY